MCSGSRLKENTGAVRGTASATQACKLTFPREGLKDLFRLINRKVLTCFVEQPMNPNESKAYKLPQKAASNGLLHFLQLGPDTMHRNRPS